MRMRRSGEGSRSIERKEVLIGVGSGTHSFFDLAELLKLLAEGAIVGVPGKATAKG